jgi:hypothetical protein
VQSGPWHYWLWDGAQWTTLPGDFDNYNGPVAAADFEHDGAPDLYLGGLFQSVDGVAASYMTRLVVCGTQGTIACAGDGTAAACPCGNFGAIGHGCSNSLNASGASLTSTGLASVGNDTLALTGSGMPDSAALYIQGTTQSGGGSGVVFGDGLRCAAGSVVRLGQRMNVGGISQVPSSGGPKLSVTGMSTAGSVRTYQVWYRNAASFCTASTFNLSNGLSITWTM